MTDVKITVDGVTYPVANLPPDIQNLFNVYQQWNSELSEAKLEVFKLEAAIRSLTAEVEARIRQHAAQANSGSSQGLDLQQ